MKKLLFLILALLFITACGENSETQEASTSNDVTDTEDPETNEPKLSEQSSEESIEVDKGLLSVEVTIPSSLIEGEDKEEIISEAEENGIEEVIENADGSISYKMSKAVHKEMMKEVESGINEYLEELKSSEEFISIEDVTTNKSFSEFTMIVNQESFESSFDGFAALGLGIQGLYYQLFNGVSPDDYEVIINVENVETGEVIDSTVFPEALEEMGE